MEHKDRMGRRLQIRKIRKEWMFPTLFSRLVTVYISMLVVMLMVLFVAFTNAFQSYFVEYTQDIMIKQAQNIEEEYYKIGLYSTSTEEVFEKLSYRIQVMDSYLEATTWLVDCTNRVMHVSKNASALGATEVILHESDVQQVFSGNTVRIENAFKEYFSTPVLTIGYPIKAMGEIQYALFIHTPMPLILQTIGEVRRIILNVVGITGTMGFIWIYIISKQMSKPLKEMNDVAKQVASGDFDKRIEVLGQDEISELGLSFNHMASELNKIEEKRREFLANVSHDLRSPLTSIQGFITAILDGTIPLESQEKYLKVVLHESKRMITMTNAILELSRMEEGVRLPEKTVFNIETMIRGAIISFEPAAYKKDVKVLVSFEKDISSVIGDIDLMSRVVQNLLDNAFKFVDDHGVIKINTQYREGKIWTSISNSGPIIPKEKQKEIWDRFYKGDTSRGKDRRGLGLGLVIVKEIIKLHEETIEVGTDEEGCVKFYFSLSTPQNIV